LKVEHEHAPADAFLTAEGIELKQTYSEQDIENIKHLDFGAGFAPNLRGPYATMYVADLGLYANMQDLLPKKAMLLQTKLGCWSKGLSIAFDLPTHRGYDSDHEAWWEMWEKQELRHCGRHESVVRPNSAR
jgi:methylmalonyl-CoA mutase